MVSEIQNKRNLLFKQIMELMRELEQTYPLSNSDRTVLLSLRTNYSWYDRSKLLKTEEKGLPNESQN